MNVESIGVVIPAYNAGKTIASLIENVGRQIPFKNVIVVDDGSTDRTSSICKEYVIHTVRHHTNKGKGAALKTGFVEAEKTGKILVERVPKPIHNFRKLLAGRIEIFK